MEIRPILSAMLRNKLGAVLISAQIAVTLAIICNGAFIVYKRFEKMSRPTGIDVENIFHIASMGFGRNYDQSYAIDEDLRTIRAMDGVVGATSINSIPLSGGGWGEGLRLEADPDVPSTSAGLYFVNEHGLDALGVNLVAGRNFNEQDLIERTDNSAVWPESVIVTQELADEMFPDETALGKTVYMGTLSPIKIVGIIEHMHGSWVNWDGLARVILAPGRMLDGYTRYIIRTEPGMRDSLMPRVEEALAARDNQRILRRLRSLEETRDQTYSDDFSMAMTLLVVIALLITITALGIVGLASFLVNQRTKQIGTRRALGARRFQIIRYFLVENWLITSIGLTVGLVLTIGLNYWLSSAFELPTLDWYYIPAGVVLVWILGLGAAFGPSRRAARVSPATATRTI